RALLHALDDLAIALVGAGEQEHLAVIFLADDEGVDLAAGDGAAHVLGLLQAMLERGDLGVEAGRILRAVHGWPPVRVTIRCAAAIAARPAPARCWTGRR